MPNNGRSYNSDHNVCVYGLFGHIDPKLLNSRFDCHLNAMLNKMKIKAKPVLNALESDSQQFRTEFVFKH